MMLKKFALALSAAAVLLVGCGKKENAAAAGTERAREATATKASAARTVEITGNDQMKFDVNSIEAKAGEELTVKLTNVGTLPKVAMGHNWVLLKKSADSQAFANAAATSGQSDYIPADKADQMIAHTKLLGPKESDVVTFTVPSEPGEYVYMCTFPGHFMAGMKGVLVVK